MMSRIYRILLNLIKPSDPNNVQNGQVNSYMQRLSIKDRCQDQLFLFTEQLFVAFDYDDYDFTNNKIKTATIKYFDMSCHRGKYSLPEDVKYRKNGTDNDGCYSVTVSIAKLDGQMIPVHAPIKEESYENYPHSEIRAVRKKELDRCIPIPPEKIKHSSRATQLRFRKTISNMGDIKIMATLPV